MSQRKSPVVPRWVRLPGLPTNHFASCFEGLGSAISKFVKADERSLTKENPGYGRICVEIDLSKELPTRAWLGTTFKYGFWQEIVIKGRIDYCNHCGIHGHSRGICKKVTLDTNAQLGENVGIRIYCAWFRMNNHNTEACRWFHPPQGSVFGSVKLWNNLTVEKLQFRGGQPYRREIAI